MIAASAKSMGHDYSIVDMIAASFLAITITLNSVVLYSLVVSSPYHANRAHPSSPQARTTVAGGEGIISVTIIITHHHHSYV